MELSLVAVGFLAAALGVFVVLHRSVNTRRWRSWFVGATALAAMIVFGAATRLPDPGPTELEVTDRPIEVQTDGFVSSDACQACHPDQYASWAASYHRTMTQVATPATVMGDFDDVELRQDDWVFRLERRGDEYWVNMPELDWTQDGPFGPRVDRKIVLTTGSHHMQVYWYSAGNSRALGMLPFVFNLELENWLPRIAAFVRPPEEPSSELGRWNKICLECHAVQGRLRPLETQGQDTHVAEFGISCEACHGPGTEHVAANRNPVRRYDSHLTDDQDPTIVQPENLPHDRSTEVCGQCHSTSIWTSQEAIDEFMENGFSYRAGDRLADTKAIVRGQFDWNPPEVQAVLSFQMSLLDNTFWPDGMIRLASREYNSLLETPCFQRGELSCLSCHLMHKPADDPRQIEDWADDQLKPGMRGNLACTQCHDKYREPAEVREHTHHEKDSSGSICYNCHMPYTSYALLKGVRNHQVDSPSVETSVFTGRPNACNHCHLNRSLAWTADYLDEWYGIPVPELSNDESEIAASVLQLLRGRADQRALAAWAMGWEPALEASGRDWEALFLSAVLPDPYHAVRYIARRSLRRLPGFDAFDLDSTATSAELDNARKQAFRSWIEGRPSDATTGEAILIGPDGTARKDEVLRLLALRDDRTISLAE